MTSRSHHHRLAAAALALGTLTLGGLMSVASSGVAGATSNRAAATALGRQEVLPPSAFPKGWKAQGKGSENTGANFFGSMSASDAASMAACLGISTKHIDRNPVEVASQEYDDSNSNVTVTDTVEVYPSVTQAATDAEAAANSKAPGCLEQFAASQFQSGVPKGMTVGKPTVAEAPSPRNGAHHAGVVMSFAFTYQGLSGTMYIEEQLVQQGRSETILQFTNAGSPAATSVADPLIRAAAKRLHTA